MERERTREITSSRKRKNKRDREGECGREKKEQET